MKLHIASLSLLAITCLMLAVAPAMAGTIPVYINAGPAALSTNAWEISFGFAVSDSFTVASGSSITGLSFIYWDASNTDLLTSVDMQIGTTSFGGSTQTLAGGTNKFIFHNTYGYNQYDANFSPLFVWSGAGYITLSNACTTTGCSVVTPIYWDQSRGPSAAFTNLGGGAAGGCAEPPCAVNPIPSESFTLFDPPSFTPTGTTPEPSSIMLFGSGILGLAGVLRRKLNI